MQYFGFKMLGDLLRIMELRLSQVVRKNLMYLLRQSDLFLLGSTESDEIIDGYICDIIHGFQHVNPLYNSVVLVYTDDS